MIRNIIRIPGRIIRTIGIFTGLILSLTGLLIITMSTPEENGETSEESEQSEDSEEPGLVLPDHGVN